MRLRPVNRDNVYFYINQVLLLAYGALTTWCARVSAWLWGIQLGKRVRFNGVPVLRRCPGSIIRVGSDCVFSSNTWYNLIGIHHPVIVSTLSHESRVEIGNHCGFSGTVVSANLSIRIGNNVRCGANTLITDTDWHTDDPRTTPDSPVVIQDNVWLGVNVTVLKGVTIGSGSFIAAGSIVTHSIPGSVVAGGIPAKVIREIPIKKQFHGTF